MCIKPYLVKVIRLNNVDLITYIDDIPVIYGRETAMNLEHQCTGCPFKSIIFSNKPIITKDRVILLNTKIDKYTAPYIRYFDQLYFQKYQFECKENINKIKNKYKLREKDIEQYKNTIGEEMREINEQFEELHSREPENNDRDIKYNWIKSLIN